MFSFCEIGQSSDLGSQGLSLLPGIRNVSPPPHCSSITQKLPAERSLASNMQNMPLKFTPESYPGARPMVPTLCSQLYRGRTGPTALGCWVGSATTPEVMSFHLPLQNHHDHPIPEAWQEMSDPEEPTGQWS